MSNSDAYNGKSPGIMGDPDMDHLQLNSKQLKAMWDVALPKNLVKPIGQVIIVGTGGEVEETDMKQFWKDDKTKT